METLDIAGQMLPCISPVYDMKLLNRYDFSKPEDEFGMSPLNPDYNPILDINQTAGRARYMIEDVLKMKMVDDEHFLEEIDIFLKQVNDPDIYSLYSMHSYEAQMIDRYRVLAYVGKLLGATHISAA
jgi:hypothetical protein